jgi:hypothetical protein
LDSPYSERSGGKDFSLENYFNYFTEIEDHFRKARGSPGLLTPLDWALIECWKEAGIPLAAVLTGIDRTFEKFSRRPRRYAKVNGLAYCSQSVMQAAEEFKTAATAGEIRAAPRPADRPPYTAEEIHDYLERNAVALKEAAAALEQSGGEAYLSPARDFNACAQALRSERACTTSREFEELEGRLTGWEEKLVAGMLCAASADMLAELHQEVRRSLAASRARMTTVQMESVERQFRKQRLMVHYKVPRLSLFYL